MDFFLYIKSGFDFFQDFLWYVYKKTVSIRKQFKANHLVNLVPRAIWYGNCILADCQKKLFLLEDEIGESFLLVTFLGEQRRDGGT